LDRYIRNILWLEAAKYGVCDFFSKSKEIRMCRYAEKYGDGKTYCLSHVDAPYPISDDYGHFPHIERWCGGGHNLKCPDFWFKIHVELLLIFSLITTLSYKPQKWLFEEHFMNKCLYVFYHLLFIPYFFSSFSEV